MTKNDLIQAAVELHKLRLWDRLLETDIFAIQRLDGRKDYVCIMGREGAFLAISVYRGERGFYSLINNINGGDEDEYEVESMFAQDCVMCSFEDREELTKDDRDLIKLAGVHVRGRSAWPLLRSYVPDLYPVPIQDKDDIEVLYLSIRASIELNNMLPCALEAPADSPALRGALRKIGFAKGKSPVCEWDGERFTWRSEKIEIPTWRHSPATLDNELEIARLRALPKSTNRVFYLKLVLLPFSINSDPPFLPTMPLFIDSQRGPVSLINAVNFMDEDDKDTFFKALIEYIRKTGRAGRVVIAGKRADDYLSDFFTKIGIPATRDDNNAYLKKYHMSLAEFMMGNFLNPED